ncbi:hypothetical protein [Brucella anthropi]|uniref:hypothetical protein n=1 Tax=Brucella anthropi TaxID=529 RepID=UPI000F67087E|nr:hypothetical protein [Brucella anthropi]RRY03807.1 hypothetical protein EGJ58_22145 [Brucella anthropi]
MLKTQNGAGTLDRIPALTHAGETLSRARDLSTRVELLCSRLLGTPMAGEAAGLSDKACGVLPALYDASNETAYAISRAQQALDDL